MKRMYKRIIMAFVGVVFCGISVGMMDIASFGLDPFMTLTSGFTKLLGMTEYSIPYIILTGSLLLVALVFDRHFIGIATVMNLLGSGYIVDLSKKLFENIPGVSSMPGRIIMMAAGLIVMCASSSLYFTADLGVSGYDAQSLMLAKRKLAPFRVLRISTDVACVGLGTLMGARPGVGTIITAFFMGPVIQLFNIYLSEPMLRRGASKNDSKSVALQN